MNDAVEPVEGNEKERKILTQMRKRWKACQESEDEQRRDAMEDMKFSVVPGEQWDENQRKERGGRPCYEFNKIRVTGKRIINNMRAARPAGKVRAVEDSDRDTAEIFEGIIRNIWDRASGDGIVDYACEYQVFAGYGAWRVTTEYVDDDVFEQDIGVEPVLNPFCLYADPSDRDQLKRNANYWILTDKIPRETFEEEHPNLEVVNFPTHEFDDEEDWDGDEVRVAEYWYKVPVEKELWKVQLPSNDPESPEPKEKIIDSTSDEANGIPEEAIVDRRMIKTHKIMMVIASGNAIIEGPTEWAGKHFPFIPVYGEYYIVDGKVYWNGITRFAKDPQRSYNVSRTAVTETIARAPDSKWWVTSRQAEGHVDNWKEAHQKGFPFQIYNPDPEAPGAPQRMGPADIPSALIQETQMAEQEINMVTGVYEADLGQPNQANSGKQELIRQQAGHIATFNYGDNAAKAIERTWQIFVDLIPKIYTTEREMRVLGQDEREDYVKINTVVWDKESGQYVTAHDLTMGKYDVTISTGVNFTTKRQEAAEIYQPMLQASPELTPIVGDLVFRAMDLPYADEIAERLQAMAPPQIQQLINGDEEVPPEVQAMMAQAQQAMQQVEVQMQEVQQEASDAKVESSKVKEAIANLKTDRAQFDAHIAKETAKLEKVKSEIAQEILSKDSDGVIEVSRQEAQQFNAQIGEAVTEAMTAILEIAGQFEEKAVETMETIKQEKDKKPKVTRIDLVREKGKASAVPVYE